MDIDNEVLITLVEARPVLWDKTLDNYKDRNLTRKAWNEVCIGLNSEFEELGDKDKNTFGKEVTRRWRNLRDAFAKFLKKINESKSSGSTAKKIRQYVFTEELSFLKKIYAERETVNSLSEEDGCVEDGAVAHQLVGRSQTEEAINSGVIKKPMPTIKHKKVDEVELKILKASDQAPEKSDPNMLFFQSLLPHLKNFTVEEILQFQLGILQVISNLNERKKVTVHPPQYSQQTNYYNPSHPAHPSFSQPPPFHNQPPKSLIPAPRNQMSQQYHPYNQPPSFKQFSQSPAVPSQTQPLTTGTLSKNSPLAHHSSFSYTRSKTALLSKNDNSSNLATETDCLKPVDQFNEDFFRSEASNSGVSSPESIYSVDFTSP